MNAKQKKVVLAIAAVAAAYLAYRWWSNRQSNGPTGLGTNLNSLPTALVGGSTGPQSGLNYYAGSTSIYVTQPVNQSASKSSSTGPSSIGGHKPPIVPPWGGR